MRARQVFDESPRRLTHINPQADGWFLEVKSRTWSRRDAQDKAAIITDLLDLLGARQDDTIEEDYVEWEV